MPIEFKKGAISKPETETEELDIMSEVITGVSAILEDATARAQIHYDNGLPPEFQEAQVLRWRFSRSKPDLSNTDPDHLRTKEEPQQEEQAH